MSSFMAFSWGDILGRIQLFCENRELLRQRVYFGALVCLVVAGTIFCSYWLYSKQWETWQVGRLTKAKNEITRALRKYDEALNLLESRLVNALKDERLEEVPRILSLKMEAHAEENFPEISSIIFTPASHPQLSYSRSGPKKREMPKRFDGPECAVVSLGNYQFQSRKTQQALGELQTSFSVAHIIERHFLLDELSVVSLEKAPLKGCLSFKISSLPYVFALKRTTPSFGEYFLEYKFLILLMSILSWSLFSLVYSLGELQQRKRNIKIRRENRLFGEQIRRLNEASITQNTEIEKLTEILKSKAQSQQGINFLFNDVQERYRKMMLQVLALNSLILKFLSDETTVPREIYKLSWESNFLLKRILKGTPMVEEEESVDIVQCFDKIYALFLPDILERKFHLKTGGTIKKPVFLDKGLLEFVFYNLLHRVVDHTMKEGFIEIKFKDGDPLQISFYDNGYDMEDVQISPEAEDTFYLRKRRLQDLAHSLGWTLEFGDGKGHFHNAIVLSIPRRMRTEEGSNVINLFHFNKSNGEERETP